MLYKLIPLKQRLRIREICRQSVLDTGGDQTDAINLARKRIRRDNQLGSIVTSILIGLAVRLAIALIQYWLEERFSNGMEYASIPQGDFQKGEPGS